MTIPFAKGQYGKMGRTVSVTVQHVLLPYFKYKLRIDKNYLYLNLQNKYLNFHFYDPN